MKPAAQPAAAIGVKKTTAPIVMKRVAPPAPAPVKKPVPQPPLRKPVARDDDSDEEDDEPKGGFFGLFGTR